jgi:hypothetical protein
MIKLKINKNCIKGLEKKIRTKLKKIIYHKLELNNKIENK